MNLDNLRRAVILAEDLLEALEAIALDSEPMAEADDHAERARGHLLRAQLAIAEADALAEADAIIKARTPPQRPAFPSWPAPGHKLPRHPHPNQ